MTAHVSLLRKALVHGALAALAVFTAGIVQVLDGVSTWVSGEADYSLPLSLLTALVVGAGAAALRAVMGYFTTILPGDAVHGPNAAESVTLKS